MNKLDSGNRVDIRGNEIIVEGGTFHIKDDLKALGMQFRFRSWRYTPKSDQDAIEFLQRLHDTFPNWDEQEFGDLLELL
jgi:hypothetical protein